MAAYPTISQSYSTTKDSMQDTTTSVGADGTVRGQNFYSNTVYEFSIVHEKITEAQKDEIELFYDNNKLLPFTFNYAGDLSNYNLIFKGRPDSVVKVFGTWDVTTTAIGTKV